MPAPSTNNHEPTKVYFSRSEAMEKLGCTKYDLRKWTAYLGFKEGGGHHRYSVDELNRLAVIRKTNTPRFDRAGYMREYMAKYRKMGKGRYIRKKEN